MSWHETEDDNRQLTDQGKQPLMAGDKDSIMEGLDASPVGGVITSLDALKEIEYADKVPLLIGLYFVLGVINNSGYTMINTSAQDLATNFGKKDLMGAFQLCLSILSILLRFLNSQYLLRVPHALKIGIVVCIWVCGYTIFYSAFYITDSWLGFGTCLLATLLIGNFASIANVTAVGFMKTFPARVVSGFSSGTGFAGIVGSGITLMSKVVSLPFSMLCLIFIPVSICYFFIFRLIQAQKKTVPGEEVNPIQDARGNQNMSFENIRISFRHLGSPIINLTLVYYLEYACLVSFIDRANPKYDEKDDVAFIRRYAVICLSLTYQIGVFISRSSLPIIKIERVTLITIGQFIVYLIFFSVAIWKWLDVYGQIPLMFICGLFGGSSFVNCYYLVMKNDTIDKSVREVAIGVMGIFNEIGVISASIFSLFISNFVLTTK